MKYISRSHEDFIAAVHQAIDIFPSCELCNHVRQGSLTLAHYHTILVELFHQTRSSPYTFAKAAAHCSWRHAPAKEYLLRHAEEEQSHWRWILDDLCSTGYRGPDPQRMFPHWACEAYISFNERVAERMPLARLAVASVLEGIGAAHGGEYGVKLIELLGLETHQTSFFLSHAITDQKHSEEIMEVIHGCDLTPEEWGWMTHAASVAGHLYRRLYDHETIKQA
jgi:hypothetical protein